MIEFKDIEKGDWKFLNIDSKSGDLVCPGGSSGHRWDGKDGNWNMKFEDAETGKTVWVDTSSRKVRNYFNKWSDKKRKELDSLFARFGIDMVKVYTGEDYVKPLMNMFKKRGARR